MATPRVSPELARAAEHIHAGERDAAGRLLKAYLADHPRDAEAWWLMSQIVTRPDNVRACLERVVRLRPDDARARECLARLARPDEPDDAFFAVRPAAPLAPATFDPTHDLGDFDPFAGIDAAPNPFTALRGQQPGTGSQPEWGPGLSFVSERPPQAPARAAHLELSRGTIALIAGVCGIVVLVVVLLVLARQRGWLGGGPDMRVLDGGSFTLEYPESWGAECAPGPLGTPVCGIANDPRYNTLDLYTGQQTDFAQEFAALAGSLLSYESLPDLSVSVIVTDFPSGAEAYQRASQAKQMHDDLIAYGLLRDDFTIDYDERQQTIDGRAAWVYRLDVQDTSSALDAFVTGGQGDWALYDVYVPHEGGTLWLTAQAMASHNRVEIPRDALEHIIESIDLKADTKSG